VADVTARSRLGASNLRGVVFDRSQRTRPEDRSSTRPAAIASVRAKTSPLAAATQIRFLQQSAGNRAVTRLLRAAATAEPTESATDPAIEALDLKPKAKAAAYAIKKKFPAVSFTSGKRDEVDEQASAMASNVVSNRNWITETYADKALSAKLQKWLDDNPKATTKAAITKGLADTMSTWTEEEKGRLSAHFTGEAFDIQPQADKAEEIKAEANNQATTRGGKFLEKEGGLIRWHVQIRE
jgi:hypothetical protein